MPFSSFISILTLLTFLSTEALADDFGPKRSSSSQEVAFPVAQYLESPHGPMVVLRGGQDRGILEGARLTTYRPSNESTVGPAGDVIWVETGALKVVEVQNKVTIARVDSEITALSEAFFPKFPGIMAGDLAMVRKVSVERRQLVTPTMTLSYFNVFVDPKVAPSTFELKEEGLEELRRAAQVFAGARLSLLMVEGHTDGNGPASANQVESYQRALTVRQFLIDEMGFDERRVVALGFGESELLDSSRAPGAVRKNRRIVLKAIATPDRRF